MQANLQQRVERIRGAVARMQAISAWSWTLGMILAAALFVGFIDAAFRLRQWPLRLLLTAAVIAVAVWAVRRWLLPWWRTRHSDVQIARRLEHLHPQLGERLSSALAFLKQAKDDPREGSLELRFAVVAEAEAIAADLPLEQSVDRRPRNRALAVMASLAVMALALFLWQPTTFGRAVVRLANPFGGPIWPPRHRLELVEAPTAVALGQSFEVQVVDRNGRPPADAAITLEFDQPGRRNERHLLAQRGDKLLFRIDQVLTSFRYRVSGGDDDSHDWRDLLVVQPPKLTDIVSHVTPPAYAGLTAYRGGRLVKLLAGSRLSVSGTFDRAVGSIKLVPVGGETVPALELSKDGLSFHTAPDATKAWTPTKPQQVWLELTGAEAEGSLVSREGPLELQVVADSPPSIAWDQPADHAAYTAQALVPVSAVVKDDLAVQRVELRFAAIGSEAMTPQVVVLWEAKQALETSLGQGDSRTVTHAWDLAQLAMSAEGVAFSLQLAASDFHGQATLSSPRRISVIGTQDMQHRLVQRQGAILEQLGEVLRLQRQARGLIGEIAARQADEGKWQPRDLDVLQSAELQQRQVQRLLKNPDDGLGKQVELLLAELAANRLADEGIATRMQTLQKQIRRLNDDVLPPLEEQLAAALKTARLRAEDSPNSGDCADEPLALDGITQQQDLAVTALEAMLGELAQWDSFSRIAREVGLLKQEQQKLRDQAESVRVAIALAERDTEPHNLARQTAQRQLEAARQFDKLQQRMEALLAKLQEGDPLAAGSLAAALEAAQQQAIGGQMRSAARQLQEVKPGNAVQMQDLVLAGLNEVLDRLASRRDQDARRTLAALNAAAEELNRLGARNENLAREANAAAAAQDPQKRQLQRLTKDAERLAQEVAELARKLQRLQAKGANEATQRAAQALRGAGQSAAGGDGANAEAQTKSALEDLKQARQELQQAIQKAQQDLVREELARLETELAGLLKRQMNLLAETKRLDEANQKDGLSRAQQQSLRDVAEEQRQLADAVQQSSDAFSSGETFDLALAGVRQIMQRAHRWLIRGQTDANPQTAQQQAIDRLQQLLAAARSPAADLEENEQPMGQGQEQPNDGPPQVRSLGELQLLAQLQAEINRRTAELEAAREQAGDFTAEQVIELQELAAEQGKLAEIVLKLVQQPAPEEDPPPMPMAPKPAEPKKPGSALDEELLKDLK